MSKIDSYVSVTKIYVEEGRQLSENGKLDEAIEKSLIGWVIQNQNGKKTPIPPHTG